MKKFLIPFCSMTLLALWLVSGASAGGTSKSGSQAGDASKAVPQNIQRSTPSGQAFLDPALGQGVEATN